MKIFSVLALLTLAVSSAFAADQAAAPTVPAAALPEINHLVYLSELPESADLMASAAANGLTVTRLDRTSDRVVVSFRYPNGQTATLGYALLASAGNADRVAPRRTVTTVTRQPEIVYVERPYSTHVVYSDPYDNFWLPLTLGVGLGWATSYHGYYGYYGGHHGHGGWHHR